MMVRIIDYKILAAATVAGLEKVVKKEMETGWQPAGGMQPSKTGFYQTLLKYDNKPFIN